jgi:hypothetical protein
MAAMLFHRFRMEDSARLALHLLLPQKMEAIPLRLLPLDERELLRARPLELVPAALVPHYRRRRLETGLPRLAIPLELAIYLLLARRQTVEIHHLLLRLEDKARRPLPPSLLREAAALRHLR